jgi:hypothetical protein
LAAVLALAAAEVMAAELAVVAAVHTPRLSTLLFLPVLLLGLRLAQVVLAA